jgi:hypothetical protein
MNRFEMPAQLKAAGMTVDQCRVAYFYWMRRRDLAQSQRNSLLGALFLVGSNVLLRFAFPAPLPETLPAEPLVNFLIDYMVPIALGIFAFSMIVFETAKAIENKKIADPVHGMSREALTLVMDIGKSAARSSWLFRKIPYKQQ